MALGCKAQGMGAAVLSLFFSFFHSLLLLLPFSSSVLALCFLSNYFCLRVSGSQSATESERKSARESERERERESERESAREKEHY
jgi:hypothetical protein